MRIVSLFSSSKANSTYIENNGEGILVDVGCSYKALCEGLKAADRSTENIRAVFITHEHIDHTKALSQLTKHTDIPIYASDGTAKRLICDGLVQPDTEIHGLSELKNISVDMDISFFHTPHDCAESVGYKLCFGEHRVACCTDLGYVTDEVRTNLLGCDTVYIEANYDPKLLNINTKYPAYLKKRISGDYGHLSNINSAEFCAQLVDSGARRLILGHLSQENNTPRMAYDTVEKKLNSFGMTCGIDYTIDVAPVMTDGKYIII